MSEFQAITYKGEVAAAVIADNAILVERLAPADRYTVELMCLYAMQVITGERPGPYTDEQALAYAHRATATAATPKGEAR